MNNIFGVLHNANKNTWQYYAETEIIDNSFDDEGIPHMVHGQRY